MSDQANSRNEKDRKRLLSLFKNLSSSFVFPKGVLTANNLQKFTTLYRDSVPVFFEIIHDLQSVYGKDPLTEKWPDQPTANAFLSELERRLCLKGMTNITFDRSESNDSDANAAAINGLGHGQ